MPLGESALFLPFFAGNSKRDRVSKLCRVTGRQAFFLLGLVTLVEIKNEPIRFKRSILANSESLSSLADRDGKALVYHAM